MAANQKHWVCNRLGRPFRDICLYQTGGVLRQTSPRQPLPTTKRYLEVICLIMAARNPRQRKQPASPKACNREGGPATTRGFDPQPYLHIYTYIYIYVCTYLYGSGGLMDMWLHTKGAQARSKRSSQLPSKADIASSSCTVGASIIANVAISSNTSNMLQNNIGNDSSPRIRISYSWVLKPRSLRSMRPFPSSSSSIALELPQAAGAFGDRF